MKGREGEGVKEAGRSGEGSGNGNYDAVSYVPTA